MGHTRIPGISTHKRPLATFESLGMPSKRTHILEDVTNTTPLADQAKTNRSKLTMSSIVADPNARLMNRYYYGDPNVIEEVKKRERKIARDIQHFRKSIAEIDTETKLVRERNLPDLRYENSKKSALCNELRKDLIQLTTDLDEKDKDCDVLKSNWELEAQHTQLEHKVKLQEVQNELDKDKRDLISEWETKLREIENHKPDPEALRDLERYQEEKLQLEKELRSLSIENADSCRQRSRELEAGLEEFWAKKKEPLRELRTKKDELQSEITELKNEAVSIESQIDLTTENCNQLMLQISEIKSLLAECSEHENQLMDAKNKAELTYLETKFVTDEIQTKALEVELRYNGEFDKMEKEQTRRRTMENSIDELKGTVRCFAFIGEDVPDASVIDYSHKKISVEDTVPCSFSRIIPRKLVSEGDLIGQECRAFFEVCVAKRLNFNVVSLPTGRQSLLRDKFLNYLIEKGKFKLKAQYVALSEKAASSDLFFKSKDGDDKEIQLTIKEDSIEMNSTTLELNSTQDITNSFGQLHAQAGSDNIGILKIEIWEEHKKCCDTYYLEINDVQTVKKMSSLPNINHAAKTPIFIILQTLLLKTRSLFLFNLFDENTTDPQIILESAQRIGQIEVPRVHVEDRET
ncbi:LANO_0A02696g1_1 [Lachancea nothofagi CBS 11611]|uniref:LANO_0A02696g1_1 n=1 Tax=Lachancea nothofagi CBS 11611 TaxID=1266666 RepID=A0A1G4INT8_9SACH|nr:LANO_0A02696g1_1 [Lachancea nothofagi CBS 11611]